MKSKKRKILGISNLRICLVKHLCRNGLKNLYKSGRFGCDYCHTIKCSNCDSYKIMIEERTPI